MVQHHMVWLKERKAKKRKLFQELPLFHPHNHLSEERNNGWTMDKILLIGRMKLSPRPTLEFHINRPLRLKVPHQMDWLRMQRASQFQVFLLFQPLNLSLEVRNNGWITRRTLVTGVRIRWSSLTLEFLTNLRHKLRDQLHLESLVLLIRDLHSHLLSHLSEVRSNGWTTHKILEIGEKIK